MWENLEANYRYKRLIEVIDNVILFPTVPIMQQIKQDCSLVDKRTIEPGVF
jgi:hypothetical protein